MSLAALVQSSQRLRPATKRVYVDAVRRFEEFAGVDLSGVAVERWRDSLLVDGLDPATVYKLASAIRYVSHRRANLGLGDDFARGAELPARPAWTPREALSAHEYGGIAEVCARDLTPRGLRDRPLFKLAAEVCGARRSELADLLIGSYTPPTLMVPRKGGWSQRVFMDLATQRLLDAWIEWRGGRRNDSLFTSLRRTIEDRWVSSGPLSGSGVAHVVAERAREAGIVRRVGPHLLRHTFISLALAAGVPPHRVMVAAGHRSLVTTSRYVTDVQADEAPIGGTISEFVRAGGSR